MITPTEERGKYAVSLFLNEKQVEIVVDEEVPYDPEAKSVLYSHEKNSMWVSLLEKAIAKVHCSETFYKPSEAIPLETLKHLVQVITGVHGVMHDCPRSTNECQRFSSLIRGLLVQNGTVAGFSNEQGVFQITNVDESAISIRSLYHDSEQSMAVNDFCGMVKTVVSFQLDEANQQQTSPFCYTASALRCVVRLSPVESTAVRISVFASTPGDDIPPMRLCVVDQKGNPIGGTQSTFYPASPVCSEKMNLSKGVEYRLLVEVPEASFVPYNATITFACSGRGDSIKAILDEKEADLYFVLPSFRESFGSCARCGVTLPCQYASVGGKGYHIACCVCSVCGRKLKGHVKLAAGSLLCPSCSGMSKASPCSAPKASPAKAQKRMTSVGPNGSTAVLSSGATGVHLTTTPTKGTEGAKARSSSPMSRAASGKRTSDQAVTSKKSDERDSSLIADGRISSAVSAPSAQTKSRTLSNAVSCSTAQRVTTAIPSGTSPQKMQRKTVATTARDASSKHGSATKNTAKQAALAAPSGSSPNGKCKKVARSKASSSVAAAQQVPKVEPDISACNSLNEQQKGTITSFTSGDERDAQMATLGSKASTSTGVQSHACAGGESGSLELPHHTFVPQEKKDRFTSEAIAKIWKELLEATDDWDVSFYRKTLPISTVHSYLVIAFPQITYQGIFFNAYSLCHFSCDQLVSFADFKLVVELLDRYMETAPSFSESAMCKSGKVAYDDFLAASSTLGVSVAETPTNFRSFESFTDDAISFNEAMLALARDKLLNDRLKELPDSSDGFAPVLLSDERVKLLWDKVDNDKRGRVEKSAAMKLVEKLLSPTRQEAPVLASIIFMLCDMSNDSTVDAKEFPKLVHLTQACMFVNDRLSFALREKAQTNAPSFDLESILALCREHFGKVAVKAGAEIFERSFNTLVDLQQRASEVYIENATLTPFSAVLLIALHLLEYSKTVELQPPAFPREGQASSPASKEVKQISKEDAKKLFKQFDFNGNGILSLAEIDKAVSELFPGKFSKPTLIRAYKSADISGDSFIQFKEFKKVLELLEEYQQLWEKFQAFDANGDRRISLDEFERGYSQISTKPLSKEALQREFMSFDSNNGGFILFDEFVMKISEKSLQAKKGAQKKVKVIATGKARKASYALFPKEYLQMLWLACDYDGGECITSAEVQRLVAVFFPKAFKNCAVERIWNKGADREEFERLIHLCAFVETFFAEDLFSGVMVIEDTVTSEKQLDAAEFERVLTSLRLPNTPTAIGDAFASLSGVGKDSKYITLDALMFYVAGLIYSCLLESHPVGVLTPVKLQTVQTGSLVVAPPIPLGSCFDRNAVEQLFVDFDLAEKGAIELAELNRAVLTRNPEYSSGGRDTIIFRLLSMIQTPADHYLSKEDFVFVFKLLDEYERMYQRLSQEVKALNEITSDEYQRICTALNYEYSVEEYTYHADAKDKIDFDSFVFSLAVVRALKEKWRARDAIVSNDDVRTFKRVVENVWKSFDLQSGEKVRFGELKAALPVMYEHLAEKDVAYASSWAGLSPADLAEETQIDFKTFCTFVSFVETNERFKEFLVANKFFPRKTIVKEDMKSLATLLGVSLDEVAFDDADKVELEKIYPDITKAYLLQANWFDFEKFLELSVVPEKKEVKQASEPQAADDESLLELSDKRLKEIWQIFDNNGNGIVSLAEIDRAMIIVFPKYAKKKSVLLRAYKAADVSGDGYIQKKEFKMLFTLIVEYDHLHQKFSELDSNGDHRISFEEFVQGAKILGMEGSTPQKLKSLFDGIDSNAGGKILFDEFVMFFAKKRVELNKQQKQAAKTKTAATTQSKVVFKPTCTKATFSEQRLKELWDTFDYNHNGVLSLAEIDKAVLILFPKYFKHKRALMRAYKAADASGDCFIQKNEFKKLLEYIELYDNLWQMFEQVDKSGDNRLSLEEFKEDFEYLFTFFF